MARIKRYLDSRASDSHERWLVSYADFITLLFAFFVVMYAISSVNEGKYRVLGDSVGTAFGIPGPVLIQGPSQSASGRVLTEADALRLAAQRRQQQSIADTARRLSEAFGGLVTDGQVRVAQNAGGIMVDISASVLFAPGQATLSDAARTLLLPVAQALRSGDSRIQVEGHTDDIPIATPLFPSNWELSAARSSGVVRRLVEGGVAAERLAAVGYGEFRPLERSGSPEARARNRRVSLNIIPRDSEPAAASGPDGTMRSFPPMEFPVPRP